MNKILVVCGPTGTGKTPLAISLCREFKGEILSADSRQVYIGMDIGTGKDLPASSRFVKAENLKLGFYLVQGIRLWGYDLTGPDKDFSVSDYVKVACKIIKDIWRRGKLPVVTGGTGLYIKSLIDGAETLDIPRNPHLRKNMESKSAVELFEILAEVNPLRAGKMNASDKGNPRRLIRAIEIALYSGSEITKECSGFGKTNDVLFIGLSSSLTKLSENISQRVQKRVDGGFDKEIKNLLAKSFSKSPQAITAMGYRQWVENSAHKNDSGEFVLKWTLAEQKYVKRQLTWFKRDERINWFDITDKNLRKNVAKKVGKWYHGGNEAGGKKS